MTMDETEPRTSDLKLDEELAKPAQELEYGEFGANTGQPLGAIENLRRVDEAVEAIGFGKFQWQLTFTCTFGFLADQMLLISISLITPEVSKEFGPRYPTLLLAAQSAGLLIGAVVLGAVADNLGRKLVWQLSIFGVSIMAMILASSPNWTVLNCFLALTGFFGGGNLAIDLTILAESIPRNWSFILSGLAIIWGIGNTLTGAIAWPLLVNYGCPIDATPETCFKSNNMGWRYLYLTLGGICLAMAFVRAFVIRTTESPRWLMASGRIDEAVEVLNHISAVNKSSHRVSSDIFIPVDAQAKQSRSLQQNWRRFQRLFSGPKQLRLIVCLIVIWLLIGIAYPLYTVFLPYYLAAHGAALGKQTKDMTYHDWTISSVVGIFGPVLSMYMVSNKWLLSRKSMLITGLACVAFSGAFTTVRSTGQNLAFSSMINFWLNALYSIIYSYTPQALSVENRGLGNGLLMALCRLSSLVAPFVATFADVTTPAPIWVSCGCYIAICLVALALPVDTAAFQRTK